VSRPPSSGRRSSNERRARGVKAERAAAGAEASDLTSASRLLTRELESARADGDERASSLTTELEAARSGGGVAGDRRRAGRELDAIRGDLQAAEDPRV
jgi:hypothetical protein